MDKIKKVILILTIIALLIISFIIIIIMQTNKKVQKMKENDEKITMESFQENNKLTEIDYIGDYIFLKECLNKYINYSENLRYILEDKNHPDKETIEQAVEVMKSIIPEFVVKELNITEQNLYSKVGIADRFYRIENAYKSLQTVNTKEFEESTAIYAYYIDGILIDKNTKLQEVFEIIILLDKINGTFEIIPENYIKEKNINISQQKNIQVYNNESIPDKENNLFDIDNPTKEEICKNYFLELKNNLLYDRKYVYDSLEEEYRKNKFTDYEEFSNYIENKFTDIKKRTLQSYNVIQDAETQYVLKDQYDNIYIFNEKTPLKYTLVLDTYTIDLPEFIEKYNTVSEGNKVSLNIGKIIEAINNQDYKYVYSKLDENFKNNRFKEMANFENYIKNNYYNKNVIKEMTYKIEGNVFICELQIINKENQEQMKVTIMMKLLEKTNFAISFSM